MAKKVRKKVETVQEEPKKKKLTKTEKAEPAKVSFDEDYIEVISEKMEALKEDLFKSLTVAAAAKRVRGLSNELTKLFKDYRKVSVAAFKKE